MAEPMIVCPNCSSSIPLTESLAAPLLKATRAKFEQALAEKEQDFAGREQSLREQRAVLEQERTALDETVAAKLEDERKRIVEQESAKAQRLAATELATKVSEIADLNVLIQDREAKLAVAQNAQAELVRRERELDDARRGIELTIQD